MASAQDLDAFREEARSWLNENFPDKLANKRLPGIAGFGSKLKGDWKIWQDRIGQKGWSAPTWPAEYGGGGLTPDQAAVVQQEMRALGAVSPIGGLSLIHI